MIWVEGLDNVFNVSEEVDYLAEDGSNIVTEYRDAIFSYDKVVGQKSGAVATLLWSNRANLTAIPSNFGETEKYFANKNGMLSEKSIRSINSKNIQAYSYEVHAGMSVDVYKKLIQETVHPAGYYLSGVVDFTESIIDELRVVLAYPTAGQGGQIMLAIQAALGSIYLLSALDETAEKLYQHREHLTTDQLTYSLDFEGRMDQFDYWVYPQYRVWTDGEETHNMWVNQILPPPDVYLRTSVGDLPHVTGISGTYTQTASTNIVITKNAHGITAGPNTWVYVSFPSEEDVRYASAWLEVISATTNTFTVNGLVSATASGNVVYWTAEDAAIRLPRQVTIRNVTYSIDTSIVTVTSLPTTHNLNKGHVILVESDAGLYKYVQITGKTDTTITFGDVGLSGAVNISFTYSRQAVANGWRPR
jgi:hypothetical protein